MRIRQSAKNSYLANKISALKNVPFMGRFFIFIGLTQLNCKINSQNQAPKYKLG